MPRTTATEGKRKFRPSQNMAHGEVAAKWPVRQHPNGNATIPQASANDAFTLSMPSFTTVPLPIRRILGSPTNGYLSACGDESGTVHGENIIRRFGELAISVESSFPPLRLYMSCTGRMPNTAEYANAGFCIHASRPLPLPP